jgi:PAP2 superfamily
MKVLTGMLRLICLTLLASFWTAAPACADVISQWNDQVLALGGASRTLAMVHVAMFDAINAIQPRYRPYLQLPAPPDGALPEAAAASAAYGVLVRLLPARLADLNVTLASSLASLPDGAGKTNGIQYGDVVAYAMYQSRLTDNVLVPGPIYVSSGTPGAYQITSPGPPQPINTNAQNWIPFALTSASQFRPVGPPALTSRRYADDLNETRALGELTSPYRTAIDDETARWHTELAQFQLNRIARAEIANDGRDLLDHARLFALLNLALTDAATSVFDAKYAYLFWRPVTAIRNADLDDNKRTVVDAGWAPFLTTPPHPEYPAAHGVIQTAGARVLEKYFGQHYAFETTSPTVPGVTRHYEDFDAFAEEGGFARILGGMHFRNSIEVGHRQGKSVANWILEHYLLPLDDDGGW